jgi:glycosyltransferase involved in cell wall biosynthesis
MIIDVIIPAFNEQNGVGQVIRDLPLNLVREIIVVNNNSNDKTSAVAAKAGATVLDEPRKGYGYACLKGMDYIALKDIKPDVVVFLDADYSDHPEELAEIVQPIISEHYDLVIGSRALGMKAMGSMTPQQIFGNWLATRLIRLFFKIKYTDLGPFRAIKYTSLLSMNMSDKTYGWTVEMQIKAAKKRMKITEVPVSYRVRIGKSKVSGTLKGTILAGYKILYTIFKYSLR